MTRDYAKKSSGRRTIKRQTKKRSGHQGAPGWLWLLAGVLIGALVMALMQLSEVSPEDVEKAASETGAGSQEDDIDGPKPRFDFYTLLRDSEVIVPDTPDTKTTLPAADNEVFLLQVGSFKSSHDADSLRARLLLLNLSVSIETVSPRRNEIWHRVLVGPFSGRPELTDARSRLSSNGIESLLLKRKQ
jgi:cell division protein FtsN